VVGAKDEDRDRRAEKHRLGHAAEDEAPEAAPAVGRHHDQIGLLGGCGLDDRGGGGATPHVRFDAPNSPVRELPDDGRQIFLGLANRSDLGLDGIGARPSEGFRRAQETDRGPVFLSKVHDVRQRPLG